MELHSFQTLVAAGTPDATGFDPRFGVATSLSGQDFKLPHNVLQLVVSKLGGGDRVTLTFVLQYQTVGSATWRTLKGPNGTSLGTVSLTIPAGANSTSTHYIPINATADVLNGVPDPISAIRIDPSGTVPAVAGGSSGAVTAINICGRILAPQA